VRAKITLTPENAGEPFTNKVATDHHEPTCN